LQTFVGSNPAIPTNIFSPLKPHSHVTELNPYHPAKAVGVPGATETNIGSTTCPAGKPE